MHESVHSWAESVVDLANLGGHAVYDVGSKVANGSLRDLFSGPYVGVDLTEGPGVDVIHDMEERPIDRGGYGITAQGIVCTEVLEHVRRPERFLNHLRRTSLFSGFLILTCRGYDDRGCWPVHEHPIDVWRFSDTALEVLCEDTGWMVCDLEADPAGPGWLLFAAAV